MDISDLITPVGLFALTFIVAAGLALVTDETTPSPSTWTDDLIPNLSYTLAPNHDVTFTYLPRGDEIAVEVGIYKSDTTIGSGTPYQVIANITNPRAPVVVKTSSPDPRLRHMYHIAVSTPTETQSQFIWIPTRPGE